MHVTWHMFYHKLVSKVGNGSLSTSWFTEPVASIGLFIRSFVRFISMFEEGTVYISKKVDVYELLDSEDLETLDSVSAVHTIREEL